VGEFVVGGCDRNSSTGARKCAGRPDAFPYSSEHSLSDALELAENLGIQTHTLPIGDLMQAYDHTLAELFAGTQFLREKIFNRGFGNLLMAIANKFGLLLLSTGNKSEMAVGCTPLRRYEWGVSRDC